jgi:hypothetical protein
MCIECGERETSHELSEENDKWRVQCLEPSSLVRVIPPGAPKRRLRGPGVPRGGSVLRPPSTADRKTCPRRAGRLTRSPALEAPHFRQGFFLPSRQVGAVSYNTHERK